jgi:hypothetical protein
LSFANPKGGLSRGGDTLADTLASLPIGGGRAGAIKPERGDVAPAPGPPSAPAFSTEVKAELEPQTAARPGPPSASG